MEKLCWKIHSRIRYTEHILKASALKKFKSFLLSYKETVDDDAGNNWTTGEAKSVFMENLCTIDKANGIDAGGIPIIVK